MALFEHSVKLLLKIPLDKDMKRGYIYASSFDSFDFSLIKWIDIKAVHFLTNFLSAVPTQNVKRKQVGPVHGRSKSHEPEEVRFYLLDIALNNSFVVYENFKRNIV